MDNITEVRLVWKNFFDIFDLITDGNNIWSNTFDPIAILLYLSLDGL